MRAVEQGRCRRLVRSVAEAAVVVVRRVRHGADSHYRSKSNPQAWSQTASSESVDRPGLIEDFRLEGKRQSPRGRGRDEAWSSRRPRISASDSTLQPLRALQQG